MASLPRTEQLNDKYSTRTKREKRVIGFVVACLLVGTAWVKVAVFGDTPASNSSSGVLVSVAHLAGDKLESKLQLTAECSDLAAGQWAQTPTHNNSARGVPTCNFNITDGLSCAPESIYFGVSWATESTCGQIDQVNREIFVAWMTSRIITLVGGPPMCQLFHSLLCVVGDAIDVGATKTARQFLFNSFSGGPEIQVNGHTAGTGCGHDVAVLLSGGIVAYFPAPARIFHFTTIYQHLLHPHQQQQQIGKSILELRQGDLSEQDVLLVEDGLGVDWRIVMQSCGQHGNRKHNAETQSSVSCNELAQLLLQTAVEQQHQSTMSSLNVTDALAIPTTRHGQASRNQHVVASAAAWAFSDFIRDFRGNVFVVKPPTPAKQNNRHSSGFFFSRHTPEDPDINVSVLASYFAKAGNPKHRVIDLQEMALPTNVNTAMARSEVAGGSVSVACGQHQHELWHGMLLVAHLCSHAHCVTFRPQHLP